MTDEDERPTRVEGLQVEGGAKGESIGGGLGGGSLGGSGERQKKKRKKGWKGWALVVEDEAGNVLEVRDRGDSPERVMANGAGGGGLGGGLGSGVPSRGE